MTIKYNDKFIDNVGRTVFTVTALCDFIRAGKSINGLLVEENEDSIKYNKLNKDSQLIIYTDDLANMSVDEVDSKATATWKTPIEYQITDEELMYWLFDKCSTDIECDIVLKELNMYEERNLYPLLKHLIYLVDHFRKNNIVWGVGRGSSVSSYILYLIGIHKVDSIKYGLNINEFLR